MFVMLFCSFYPYTAGKELLVYLHTDVAQKSNDSDKPEISDMTGNLNCPFIKLLPLTAFNRPGSAMSSSSSVLSKDIEAVLKEADSKNLYSIAIPLTLSSENVEFYADGILEAIKRTLKKLKSLREIYVYASGDEEVKVLKTKIHQVYKDPQSWIKLDLGALILGTGKSK